MASCRPGFHTCWNKASSSASAADGISFDFLPRSLQALGTGDGSTHARRDWIGKRTRQSCFSTFARTQLPAVLYRNLQQVLPALSRDQVKKLLQELKKEDAIRLLPLAARRLARRYPGASSSAERVER